MVRETEVKRDMERENNEGGTHTHARARDGGRKRGRKREK